MPLMLTPSQWPDLNRRKYRSTSSLHRRKKNCKAVLSPVICVARTSHLLRMPLSKLRSLILSLPQIAMPNRLQLSLQLMS